MIKLTRVDLDLVFFAGYSNLTCKCLLIESGVWIKPNRHLAVSSVKIMFGVNICHVLKRGHAIRHYGKTLTREIVTNNQSYEKQYPKQNH